MSFLEPCNIFLRNRKRTSTIFMWKIFLSRQVMFSSLLSHVILYRIFYDVCGRCSGAGTRVDEWAQQECRETARSGTKASRAAGTSNISRNWCKTNVNILFYITGYDSFAPSPRFMLGHFYTVYIGKPFEEIRSCARRVKLVWGDSK